MALGAMRPRIFGMIYSRVGLILAIGLTCGLFATLDAPRCHPCRAYEGLARVGFEVMCGNGEDRQECP